MTAHDCTSDGIGRRMPILDGTPVGTRHRVICDTCNREILSGLPDDPDDDPTTAYVLCSKANDLWFSRWVNCEDCGPVGDPEPTPRAVVAVTEFAYSTGTAGSGGEYVLRNARLPEGVEVTPVVEDLRS